MQIDCICIFNLIFTDQGPNSSDDSGEEEAVADLLGGIDEEIPKSPRGKGIRVVLVVNIPN